MHRSLYSLSAVLFPSNPLHSVHSQAALFPQRRTVESSIVLPSESVMRTFLIFTQLPPASCLHTSGRQHATPFYLRASRSLSLLGLSRRITRGLSAKPIIPAAYSFAILPPGVILRHSASRP